jgi:hypothetical protein
MLLAGNRLALGNNSMFVGLGCGEKFVLMLGVGCVSELIWLACGGCSSDPCRTLLPWDLHCERYTATVLHYSTTTGPTLTGMDLGIKCSLNGNHTSLAAFTQLSPVCIGFSLLSPCLPSETLAHAWCMHSVCACVAIRAMSQLWVSPWPVP